MGDRRSRRWRSCNSCTMCRCDQSSHSHSVGWPGYQLLILFWGFTPSFYSFMVLECSWKTHLRLKNRTYSMSLTPRATMNTLLLWGILHNETTKNSYISLSENVNLFSELVTGKDDEGEGRISQKGNQRDGYVQISLCSSLFIVIPAHSLQSIKAYKYKYYFVLF